MIDGTEFDAMLDVGGEPHRARLLVLARGADDDGLPFTSCIMLQGPRLADGSWSPPKAHPMEAAMREALERSLDAIWGPT